MYHCQLDRHKTHDVIIALLYADFCSSDIPESRAVHRDGLGNQFRRVKAGFSECSALQILHVLFNPSIHFGVAWFFVIGDDAPDYNSYPYDGLKKRKHNERGRWRQSDHEARPSHDDAAH